MQTWQTAFWIQEVTTTFKEWVPAHEKSFFGLHKMTLGLLHASHSLPKEQAVKLAFFVPQQFTQFTCHLHRP